MSIDTTFHPLAGTIVVDSTAAAQVKQAGQLGVTTFRCVARIANAVLAWGVTAPSAPADYTAVGAQAPNTIKLTVGVACYLELPPNMFFISNAVFATSNVEITGGIGGVGG